MVKKDSGNTGYLHFVVSRCVSTGTLSFSPSSDGQVVPGACWVGQAVHALYRATPNQPLVPSLSTVTMENSRWGRWGRTAASPCAPCGRASPGARSPECVSHHPCRGRQLLSPPLRAHRPSAQPVQVRRGARPSRAARARARSSAASTRRRAQKMHPPRDQL